MTPQARQHALERIREAAATTEAAWSESERREAARGLGREDWMPEPQVEMELTQGTRQGQG